MCIYSCRESICADLFLDTQLILKRRVAHITVKWNVLFCAHVAMLYSRNINMLFQIGILITFLKDWDFISDCEACGFDDMMRSSVSTLALQIGALNKKDEQAC